MTQNLQAGPARPWPFRLQSPSSVLDWTAPLVALTESLQNCAMLDIGSSYCQTIESERVRIAWGSDCLLSIAVTLSSGVQSISGALAECRGLHWVVELQYFN